MKIAPLLSALIVFQSPVSAADWPQWQGPARDGVSRETGLLQEWPKDGPPLAWTAKDLGGGDSTPSVAAGRIYGMSHRGGDEVVWALSEKDGKEIWAVKTAPAHSQSWNQSKEGPGCTPTVDGDLIYVMGLAGNLVCLQKADGKVVWTRNLAKDFGGRSPMWSFRESPLVDGDKVLCTPGGAETTMAALNKKTGAILWKTFVPDKGTSTPGAPTPNRPPAPNLPNVMRIVPLLSSLDKDHNDQISAEELATAPDILLKMDQNQDGKLTDDELSPPQAGGGGDQGANNQRRRRGPGMMRMLKAFSALDADESDAIEEPEIKSAAATLLKLDENHDGKLTGDEAGFKSMGPQETGAAYSSPIAISYGGQRQYVQFLATTVAGVAAEDGRLLWRYDKPANSMRINITTPVYQDGQVFASSAYGAGGGLVRLAKGADGAFTAEEAWFTKAMENHHGGVILHDGALFGANGGNGGGYLACLDLKTGDTLWDERDREKRRASKGSMILADGRIYYRTEEGAVLLIEPSRTEYLERGRFTQPGRTRLPAWAHPVVANGKLYIRDQDTLYCYSVQK